jgi:primase-polymerase (primpol)-like protein
MTIIPSHLPEELIALPQWVIWRYETRNGGKPTKVPHDPQGYHVKTTDPSQWSTFNAVINAASRPGWADGIGFVFTTEDPFCGIDLDNVWQSDGDEGAAWGIEILERFGDTYLEESPSEHGVKIWCRATVPRGGKWPVEAGAIEIYDHARFFTVTGRSNGVVAVTNHQDDVNSLTEYLGADRSASPHTISGVIPYGTQHHTLVSLAGTMWRRGMTVEAIEAALLITNETQCERPGPPENIHRIALSAGRWQR